MSDPSHETPMPVPLPLTKEEREHILSKAMHSVAIDDRALLRYTLANAILRYEATVRELEARHSPVERATDERTPTDTQRMDWLEASKPTAVFWSDRGGSIPSGMNFRRFTDAAMRAKP